FQNFSFWNSFLEFSGKTGLLTGFSKSLFKTNRVLEQAQVSINLHLHRMKYKGTHKNSGFLKFPEK
ncbi:MAG: hypothetical protein LBL56_07235, partial [Treponema sp.]|nr:hypothetical protein [Treponema sp.]